MKFKNMVKAILGFWSPREPAITAKLVVIQGRIYTYHNGTPIVSSVMMVANGAADAAGQIHRAVNHLTKQKTGAPMSDTEAVARLTSSIERLRAVNDEKAEGAETGQDSRPDE